MLRVFNIRVDSHYSKNYYDSFVVDTNNNCVTFKQRDARRGGQVARHMTVTVTKNNTVIIEASSAEGGRYEQFSRTQCLDVALHLLDEVKSEERHLYSVNSMFNSECEKFDIDVVMTFLSLVALICIISFAIVGTLSIN